MCLFVQFQLLVLNFFLLLIAHVLAHHVLVEANRVHTVAPGPKVIDPAGLIARIAVSSLSGYTHAGLA